MTTQLRVRNWDKWQSYRQDRGTPPWIKVHRMLFTNPDWVTLTDAEKGQLVSLWIAAADNHGNIPGDCRVLRKICLLDNEPNIQKFMHLGFIEPVRRQDDAKMTPTWQPYDAPETETETETENNSCASGESRVGVCGGSDGAGKIEAGAETTKSMKKKTVGEPEYSPGFIAFWERYPNKRGKAKAFNSWKKHKCDAITAKIMESLDRHILSREWERDDGQYIPHG